jgi:predicted amidophosphoribosyltransferase
MWALGPYGDGLRAAVLAGKFGGQAAALAALGRRLGSLLLAAGVGADMVTWIAARPARGLPRDHARQVATGVAGALYLPLVDVLAPAAGRDLGRARADLDGGAGAAARPPPRVRHRLHGGRVLLVDDVATTGRTLADAAAALRHAGAREVEAAVLGASSGAFGPPADRPSPAARLAGRGPRGDHVTGGEAIAPAGRSC